MKHNRLITLLGSAIGIMILIIDSKTALIGASTGIELCLQAVIPSLFPFFVLTSVLTSAFMGSSFCFLQPFFRILGVPSGAESLVLTGFVGGYPVGAQTVASAYRDGYLSKASAERMLAFCNNAGPSFLFGMIGMQFSDRNQVLLLWGIHLLGAVFAALLLPNQDTTPIKPIKGQRFHISNAVMSSVKVMGVVCGWIVLFRIVIAFLRRWFLWLLPQPVQVAFTGLLELANGCCELNQIENDGLRFVICSGMLSLGGLCVTMQTVSVTGGLSLKPYFLGKLIQTMFSVITSVFVCLLPASGFIILALLLFSGAFCLLQIHKKRCIHEKSIV